MKNILVIVDAQNDFISGALRNEEAIKVVPKIVEKIKSKEWYYIFVTQDTHCDCCYLESQEGKNLPIKHCIENTWGWEIEDSIKKELVKLGDTCIVEYVEKQTFGSWELPYEFEKILDPYEGGDNTENTKIEICGFCTDICVLSNAILLRSAWNDVAEIIVDSNCCAGSTQEKHNAALNVMESCQIKIEK